MLKLESVYCQLMLCASGFHLVHGDVWLKIGDVVEMLQLLNHRTNHAQRMLLCQSQRMLQLLNPPQNQPQNPRDPQPLLLPPKNLKPPPPLENLKLPPPPKNLKPPPPPKNLKLLPPPKNLKPPPPPKNLKLLPLLWSQLLTKNLHHYIS